jgi:hypothetical protein
VNTDPTIHPGHEHDADAVARLRARAGDEDEREVSEHGRGRGHQHRPQARQGRLAQRRQPGEAALLQRVRELDDQDPVLRDQAHERDQPDLRVDVDRGEVEEAARERARDRERHGAEQHDQRITEAPELRGEHQIDEHDRETERHHQRRAFVADLPRFAGVVEDHPGPVRGARGVLEHDQTCLLRDAGLHAAEDAHGVALLEAVQRARRHGGLDVREGRDGHEIAGRRLDLEVEQRPDRGAVGVADLRDDLVALVVVVEAVDVRAAEQRAELAPDAGEVEPEVGDLLAVDHDARLGPIDLEVGVDVQELADW